MAREYDKMEFTQPNLADLITVRLSQHEYSELVDILAGMEAQAAISMTSKAAGQKFNLADIFYSSFIISLMLDDDLDEARALLQRLPPKLLKVSTDLDTSVAACKELHRAVWQRKYDTVYQILRHFNWPVTLIPIVQKYDAHFIQQMHQFIRGAFTAIPCPLAMRYLGNRETANRTSKQSANFIEEAGKHGWRYDETKDMLYPQSLDMVASQKSSDLAATGESVTRLVTLVGQLATPN
ncbi:MAG: hypothetical protein M1814_005750 [Vezdaea aestivalis]|nr:MAG: hypothetical protein M1814_005750 [Vezdaea aestivalis]